jgi:hypothetical protein
MLGIAKGATEGFGKGATGISIDGVRVPRRQKATCWRQDSFVFNPVHLVIEFHSLICSVSSRQASFGKTVIYGAAQSQDQKNGQFYVMPRTTRITDPTLAPPPFFSFKFVYSRRIVDRGKLFYNPTNRRSKQA